MSTLPTLTGRNRISVPTASLAADATGQGIARRAEDRRAAGLLMFTGLAVLLGAMVRWITVQSTSFPLGDGGLFDVMVRDLVSHQLALPVHTSYNGGKIPYAYPPFGFYAGAILHLTTGVSSIDVLRFVPLGFSCFALVAFALLAREVLPPGPAVCAVLAFCLLPDSFVPEIQGGGLTRAPGQFFAILTLWQLYRLHRRRGRWALTSAVAFGALTLLTHLEWAQFAAVMAVTLVLVFNRSRDGLRDTLAFFAGVGMLSSPWWVVGVSRFGVAPFVSALTSNSQTYPVQDGFVEAFALQFTHEMFLPVGCVLALVGLGWCLSRRQWFLPAAFGAVLLTDTRGWQIPLAIPLGLLIGIGIGSVALPWLQSHGRAVIGGSDGASGRLGTVGLVLVALLFLRSVMGAFGVAAAYDQSESKGERAAMNWVGAHTPVGSTFLIVPTAGSHRGYTVDWFPDLANRIGIDTPNGQEWVPGEAPRRVNMISAVHRCGADVNCVIRVLESAHASAQYVFLSRRSPSYPCVSLCLGLSKSERFVRIFGGAGAWIFRSR